MPGAESSETKFAMIKTQACARRKYSEDGTVTATLLDIAIDYSRSLDRYLALQSKGKELRSTVTEDRVTSSNDRYNIFVQPNEENRNGQGSVSSTAAYISGSSSAFGFAVWVKQHHGVSKKIV